VRNRFFNFAVVCSGVIYCLALAACFIAGKIDPRKEFLSLGRNFHLSFDTNGSDPMLEIFNDANMGPYIGGPWSILSGGNGYPAFPKTSGFRFVGMNFRLVHRPNSQTTWSLSVSLLYFLISSAILPIIWLANKSPQRRRGFPIDCKSTVPSSENLKPQQVQQ
jgi:hypothetical protein